MKFAYINDGIVYDAILVKPETIFSPGYASQFVEVPDEVQSGWLFDGTTYHSQPTQINQADIVRAERNAKLAECDWTQLPDAPVDTAAWAAYRQALRDVTVQPGFPWEVTWPAQP